MFEYSKRLFKVIRNKIYVFGFTPRPTMIANFAVTYKCNFRCSTCNIWEIYKENPEKINNELTLGEIRKYFSENVDLLNNINYIQLTGGEPFLRKDLAEIVSIIIEYLPNCHFWIPTNGLMPQTIQKVVKSIGEVTENIGIGISIHGDKEVHERITGIPGSYEKAIETIEGLVTLKKDFRKLKISLSFTITPKNFREILNVFELAKKYNIDMTFRPYNFSEIYYQNVGRRDNFGKELGELEMYLNELKEKQGINWILDPTLLARRFFLDGVLEYIKNPNKHLICCSAGSLSVFLDPYGNVYPCIIMGKKMGNIKEKSFREIWYSNEAKKIRKHVLKGNCPNCWVECETYRDIYENFPTLVIYGFKELIRTGLKIAKL